MQSTSTQRVDEDKKKRVQKMIEKAREYLSGKFIVKSSKNREHMKNSRKRGDYLEEEKEENEILK